MDHMLTFFSWYSSAASNTSRRIRKSSINSTFTPQFTTCIVYYPLQFIFKRSSSVQNISRISCIKIFQLFKRVSSYKSLYEDLTSVYNLKKFLQIITNILQHNYAQNPNFLEVFYLSRKFMLPLKELKFDKDTAEYFYENYEKILKTLPEDEYAKMIMKYKKEVYELNTRNKDKLEYQELEEDEEEKQSLAKPHSEKDIELTEIDQSLEESSPIKVEKEEKKPEKEQPELNLQLPSEKWFVDRKEEIDSLTAVLFKLMDYMNEKITEYGNHTEGKELQRSIIHRPKDIFPPKPEIRKEIITQPDFINHLLQLFLWKQIFKKNIHLPYFESTALPVYD